MRARGEDLLEIVGDEQTPANQNAWPQGSSILMHAIPFALVAGGWLAPPILIFGTIVALGLAMCWEPRPLSMGLEMLRVGGLGLLLSVVSALPWLMLPEGRRRTFWALALLLAHTFVILQFSVRVYLAWTWQELEILLNE